MGNHHRTLHESSGAEVLVRSRDPPCLVSSWGVYCVSERNRGGFRSNPAFPQAHGIAVEGLRASEVVVREKEDREEGHRSTLEPCEVVVPDSHSVVEGNDPVGFALVVRLGELHRLVSAFCWFCLQVAAKSLRPS